MRTTIVYLIYFEQPYHHAKHYLGSCGDLAERLAEHRKGKGARLLQVITEAGIDFEVVRTWKGSKKEERKLKNHKHAPRLCPMCAGDVALKRGKLEKRKKRRAKQ